MGWNAACPPASLGQEVPCVFNQSRSAAKQMFLLPWIHGSSSRSSDWLLPLREVPSICYPEWARTKRLAGCGGPRPGACGRQLPCRLNKQMMKRGLQAQLSQPGGSPGSCVQPPQAPPLHPAAGRFLLAAGLRNKTQAEINGFDWLASGGCLATASGPDWLLFSL